MKTRAARSAVESRGAAGLEAGRRRRAKAVNAPTPGNAVERRSAAALWAGVSRRASGAGPVRTRAARAKMTIGGSAPAVGPGQSEQRLGPDHDSESQDAKRRRRGGRGGGSCDHRPSHSSRRGHPIRRHSSHSVAAPIPAGTLPAVVVPAIVLVIEGIGLGSLDRRPTFPSKQPLSRPFADAGLGAARHERKEERQQQGGGRRLLSVRARPSACRPTPVRPLVASRRRLPATRSRFSDRIRSCRTGAETRPPVAPRARPFPRSRRSCWRVSRSDGSRRFARSAFHARSRS